MKTKKDRSIIPALKERLAVLEASEKKAIESSISLREQLEDRNQFISTLSAILGVREEGIATEDYFFSSRKENRPVYTQQQRILRSIVTLKEEYAREDEASGVESEKATLLMIALRAALHDPTATIEEAAKVKFLELLQTCKEPRMMMDIAHSYGVYPHGHGPEGHPIYKSPLF